MDGGEKIPMGAQQTRSDEFTIRRPTTPSLIPQSPHGETRKLRKQNKVSKHVIKWANNPEKCKREFAVKNLYPRILYAFSDIVVFVLRNDRSVCGVSTTS
jgi:hypothetical protein